MRSKTPFLALFLLSAAATAQLPLRLIRSNIEKIDVRDGQQLRKNWWTLSPEAKPDVYSFFATQPKIVSFITDVDSISITVEPGKNYDFVILLHNKDSCYTRVSSVFRRGITEFTPQFIKTQKGKSEFLVPEVKELVHVLMALTPTGLRDSNLVNHQTPYYKKVLEQFGGYQNEPVVQDIEKLLSASWINYYNLSMNALRYYFDKNNLKTDPTYYQMGFGTNNFEALQKLIPAINDFAKKTNFRAFFKKNQAYYEAQKRTLTSQMPIRQQWDWLERHFPERYAHYRVVFSPLIRGSHAAQRFNDGNFQQCMIFICGPVASPNPNPNVEEGLMTRIAFTEFDHNYVNPVSDKYVAKINDAFGVLDKWVLAEVKSSYGNAYSVFNEYMTWAVFSLYASERFSAKNFQEINAITENLMVRGRGFTKFREFNQKLLQLYQNRPKDQKVVDLYPSILDWANQK